MPQVDLQGARTRYGRSRIDCAATLGISVEGYRQKEKGLIGVTGGELAQLADLYGVPLSEAFPGYEPTDDERALARHLSDAA